MNKKLYSFIELNDDIKEIAKQECKNFVFPNEMLISNIDFSLAAKMGFENINPVLHVTYDVNSMEFDIINIIFNSDKFTLNCNDRKNKMWLLNNEAELIKYAYANNVFDITISDDYNSLHPDIMISNDLFTAISMHVKYNYISYRNDILYDIKQQIYSNYESYLSCDDNENYGFKFIKQFVDLIKFNKYGELKCGVDESQIINFNTETKNFKLTLQ